MKDAIEDIILSYIKYSKKIDIQAIKYIVNEPDYLISKRIKRLYDNGYIVKKNQEFLINEEKSGKLIEWNKIVLLQDPGDEFCVDDRGDTRFNKNGYPALNNYNNLFQLLMLDHIMLDAYHTFVIWNGKKERRILAPSWNLKKRQQWIHKQILDKYLLPDCVHGFAPQKSIVTNAKSHINMNEIGCLDIKDFFPSINGNMVFDAFMKMGYNVNVSKLLTDVCIYDNQLPQGAPTSPMLANIVFADIDKELSEYAQKNSLVYTRYADDITISCNSNIEKHLEYVKKRITEFGFEINDNKTHIMASPKRKMVTGLVVSDRVKIPRKYKRKFKQEIYYCRKYGTLQHLKNTGRTSAVNFKEYMYGKAYYIKMVEPELGWKLLRQLDDIFKVEYDA